jgi:transposase-like protein
MNERRKFSSEQKAQIVLSVLKKEVTALEASKKHNLAPSLIYKWMEDFNKKVTSIFKEGTDETEKDRKLKQYEHVIAKLTTQNDFLDKVLAVTK